MATSIVTTCIKEVEKVTELKGVKIHFRGGHDYNDYGEVIPRTRINDEVYLDNDPTTIFVVAYPYRKSKLQPYVIARWNMQEMPACCGIAVMSEFHIINTYRNKGVGAILNNFAKALASKLNYKILLCTDLVDNTHHQQLLETNKWKSLLKFRNRNTGNRINISAAVL